MIELMVAIGVLLVASMAAFSSQLASLNLIKTSRETDIAMADLQAAMEQILAAPSSDLARPGSDFPEGATIGNFDDRNLTAEQIVVTYPGYVGGAVPDPLSILLTINWNDFQGRPRVLQLSSMRAQ